MKQINKSIKYYIFVAIVLIATIFFMTSKLHPQGKVQSNVKHYFNNEIYFSHTMDDWEVNEIFETMKEWELITKDTKYKSYIAKNDDNSLLIMITRDTYDYDDSDNTLYLNASTFAEYLKRNVEFGICNNNFKIIKSQKYNLE